MGYKFKEIITWAFSVFLNKGVIVVVGLGAAIRRSLTALFAYIISNSRLNINGYIISRTNNITFRWITYLLLRNNTINFCKRKREIWLIRILDDMTDGVYIQSVVISNLTKNIKTTIPSLLVVQILTILEN